MLFTFNAKNEVTKRWFGKTLTHSNRRFTYEEAQDILNTGEGDYAEELKHLNIVAYALRKARFKAGAIQFETPEVRFKLDPNGVPLEVYVKERQDSNMLVEDFMLLANRAVGEEIRRMSEGGAPIPFVYRIHDQPNVEKLEDLALYAKSLGFSMHLDTPKQIADSINALTVAAAERDELKPLLPLAIRTMAKAVYSTNNIGHYGLGFEDYTHFTSPIRRYSDVLSHRILYKNLTRPPYRPDREKLEIRCKHISTRERAAMTAERQAVKYKQAEFLEAHVGEIFEGIISGMTDSGFFVEIVANYCEGRIDLNNLREHFTRESPFVLKGVNTGKEYRMGQRISVRVKDVDRMARQITLELP